MSILPPDLFDDVIWKSARWYSRQHGVAVSLDARQRVFVLPIEPEARSYSAKSFKAHRHLRRYRGLPGQDAVKGLTGNGEVARSLADRQPQGRQDVLAQQNAGMLDLPAARSAVSPVFHAEL
jgi:hypothetical protein